MFIMMKNIGGKNLESNWFIEGENNTRLIQSLVNGMMMMVQLNKIKNSDGTQVEGEAFVAAEFEVFFKDELSN